MLTPHHPIIFKQTTMSRGFDMSQMFILLKKKDKIRIKNIKNEILEMENPESRRGGIVGELEMCRHVQKKPRENDGAVESKA